MPIVGIFTQQRPRFYDPDSDTGLYFDATLEESTELQTDVTQFPIENGTVGHDHAVQRPLSLIMRVGITDNAFRAARAQAGDLGGAALGNLGGTAIGAGIGQLGGGAAAAAGLIGGNVSAAYQSAQSSTRSQTALEEIRKIQRRNLLINVVGIKTEYENCLIVNTRQETTKENEQALELVVELRQLITVGPPQGGNEVPTDSAATQAQPLDDLGRVAPVSL